MAQLSRPGLPVQQQIQGLGIGKVLAKHTVRLPWGHGTGRTVAYRLASNLLGKLGRVHGLKPHGLKPREDGADSEIKLLSSHASLKEVRSQTGCRLAET
jgi:hypothetical protein